MVSTRVSFLLTHGMLLDLSRVVQHLISLPLQVSMLSLFANAQTGLLALVCLDMLKNPSSKLVMVMVLMLIRELLL